MFKPKREKRIQSRSWQLIIPTGWEILEAIKERCKGIARNYYFIQHDNDKNELGEPVKPHWHLLLSFATSRELSTMQNYFKEWGDFDEPEKKEEENAENEPGAKEETERLKPNSFERVYSINGARKYLVHAEDPHKFQYNPRDVETNDKLFMNLFLPTADKITINRNLKFCFRRLNECKTYNDFLDGFDELMYNMSISQQMDKVISLRKYYNEYHDKSGFGHDDGFDYVYKTPDGFVATAYDYEKELENLPF